MSLNNIAKKVHYDARQKGFWDNDLSDEHCIVLIVGELMEIIAADRTNKKSMDDYYNLKMEYAKTPYIKLEAYDICIKGSIEEEIADSILRCFDLCGARDWDIDSYVQNIIKFHAPDRVMALPMSNPNLVEKVYHMTQVIMTGRMEAKDRIFETLINLWFLSVHYKINIKKHLIWKMRYNKLRPVKNGKKY